MFTASISNPKERYHILLCDRAVQIRTMSPLDIPRQPLVTDKQLSDRQQMILSYVFIKLLSITKSAFVSNVTVQCEGKKNHVLRKVNSQF